MLIRSRCFFIVCMCVWLAACMPLETWFSHDPPAYPNAQLITHETLPDSQRIVFSSLDQPSTIISFYKDALVHSSWTLTGEGSDYLYFGREVEQFRGFHLSIHVSSTIDGRSTIEITQRPAKGTDILMPTRSLTP
jgi:hypothetical protein